MKKVNIFLVIIGFVLTFACTTKKQEKIEKPEENMYSKDIHTYADPQKAAMKHLDLDIEVDFGQKIISGLANLQVEVFSGADEVVFDTKELKIEKVTVDGNEVPYTLGADNEYMGAPLKVPAVPGAHVVSIKYQTSPHAEALQWLDPVQTAGKESPFLFTQSQAILARSWIPLQDSPGIRFTYTAKVKVPNSLLALMSAENPTEKSSNGTYTFKMDQPIPAYLMALAVGDVAYAQLGERTGVYAEPVSLEAARYEFVETEKMVELAEGLYGPYRWGKYDIIVLPPSFPFGGMENPRLTFATPTIMAGDRSLTSLVAHELAHSWSGNLVTNATWNDFWINEGFTVYFENRIMEALNGRSYSEMLASLSLQDLKAEVAEFYKNGAQRDTHLKLDLANRNPDDGVSSIAYDKGYFFLRLMEETVGRDKWDAFLKNYFNEHAFKTMNTETFLGYMKANLFDKEGIPYPADEVQAWVYGPGLPESLPAPVSDRFAKVDEQLQVFISSSDVSKVDTSGWTTHEWMHFVRSIPANATEKQLSMLDDAFSFTGTGNAEIADAWYVQAIRHRYEKAYPEMSKFLVRTGRRKFLTPLYGELAKTKEGKEIAHKIYEKARPNYHFVSTNTIDKMLGHTEKLQIK